MAGSGKIKLQSSDQQVFEVEEEVASESATIKNMIEDTGTGELIPLPNVHSKILAAIVEYCKYHVAAVKEGPDGKPGKTPKAVTEWDQDFVKVDQATLFDIMLASNYLNIKSLLELTTKTVADMIKGKTPEELRKLFNIKNDFTPEEEAEAKREIECAFD